MLSSAVIRGPLDGFELLPVTAVYKQQDPPAAIPNKGQRTCNSASCIIGLPLMFVCVAATSDRPNLPLGTSFPSDACQPAASYGAGPGVADF